MGKQSASFAKPGNCGSGFDLCKRRNVLVTILNSLRKAQHLVAALLCNDKLEKGARIDKVKYLKPLAAVLQDDLRSGWPISPQLNRLVPGEWLGLFVPRREGGL